MCFENAVVVLKDQSLGGMESGKIGRAPSGFVQAYAKHCFGLSEKLFCLFEECICLGLHKSSPSARISCIKGMRGSL